MGKSNLNYITYLSISLLLFACTPATTSDPPLEICDGKNCGQGMCKASGTSLSGYDCQCNPGWIKIQIGLIAITSCVIPNCSLNFNCASSTPTPPPGFILPPPQVNFSSPCALVWCGEGTCVASGAAYTCKCNKDSANLMNMPGLPCFKECFLGADCQNLGLGPLTNPTPQLPPPPSAPSSGSAPSGPGGAWNSLKKIDTFIVIVLGLLATSLLT